ncbi:threonine synthase, partial [Natrinema soli]
MKTTAAFAGLECVDCGATVDAAESHRCPNCGGALDPTYDYDAIDLDRETFGSRPFDSQWRYAELLPFARESAVTTAEGATPLVDCPDLAAELGVGRVLIKDDGRNPTGSSTDR